MKKIMLLSIKLNNVLECASYTNLTIIPIRHTLTGYRTTNQYTYIHTPIHPTHTLILVK